MKLKPENNQVYMNECGVNPSSGISNLSFNEAELQLELTSG